MKAPAFRHILVAVDDSDCSVAAIHYALRLAGPAARVTFAHAINLGVAIDGAVTPVGGDPTVVLDALEAERCHVYEVATALARLAGVEAETIDLSGPIAEAIVTLAPRIGAQAIVIGTHGRRGLARALLGSIADGVLRRSSVPTFVVHAHKFGEENPANAIRRIVVDIAGNGRLTPQIELALDLAEMYDAHVFFVHLAPDSGDSVVDRDYALRIASDCEVGYDVVRGSGKAPDALLSIAANVGADLIAIAMHGHDHSGFLGMSVCESIVRTSRIPVAVAHNRLVRHVASLTRTA